MKVSLIHVTPEAEKQICYAARVSNPTNQASTEYSKLINYCIKHKHWSIFEMANMCLEIETSRMISAQILRHKSFSFQEWSQRYAKATGFELYEPRRQDLKNKQNSIDDFDENLKTWFKDIQEKTNKEALENYEQAITKGIAKECARALLPMSTRTVFYMNGSIRSWIHYLELRTSVDTQLEHRLVAEECKKIFKTELPIIGTALGW